MVRDVQLTKQNENIYVSFGDIARTLKKVGNPLLVRLCETRESLTVWPLLPFSNMWGRRLDGDKEGVSWWQS